VIHGLFEVEARRRGEAVAVVSGRERLTYDELNRRANQLARYLLGQDVRTDEAVGLMMERGPELIVTLLAILKAGAAYLPLSPDYPQERVKYAISDAGASLVISQERLKHKLIGVDVRIICLEEMTAEISGQSEDDLNIPVDAQNLAYVIYTSGSTGRPKGIGITHRSVARLVKETDYARMGESEVFLQLAPVSFDASTFEIWGSLLNGARLAIMPAHAPTLEELGESIKRYGVTTLWLTAGLFNFMVDERAEDLKPVRQLLVGGDVLSVPHVERFLKSAPESKLINGYGPTEGTTFTCCHEMNGPSLNGCSIPIGRPIANTQVYILDERLEAVPVGVVGDLYISGDGLARGYMSRADWTAEKFLPNPFCRERGGRLYDTGDLARYLADGSIEFHGRRDNQVKIRGFRIELAEIEFVLAQHSMVREVVAVARQGEGGDKRLVAYIVPAGGQEIEDASLRSYLENRLPDYMRPAAFVFLERIPLTPNGKVDRRALPAPDWNLDDSAATSSRPRTAIQEIVAAIWSEVLKLDRVGIENNFFELGGHSLLATQLISRVRETFSVEMPLRKLFESPTVEGMALSIEAMRGATAGIQAPPVEPAPRDEELPLSFAQQRLWFLDQLEPESSFYNIPVALRLVGKLDVEAFERSLDEVVDRHEVLRTIFVKIDGRIVQRIEKERSAKLIIIDLGGLDEEERERRANELSAEEAAKPFDLGRGPLLRMTLLKLRDEEHMLLSTMHHIVSDGWSMEVLVREIAALYEAFSSGNPSPLSDLPIQYADYAYWQRQWVSGEVLDGQLQYWKRQLGDAPSVLQLPTDRPRPAVQTFAGATIALPLPQAVTEALIRMSNREGVTLFMTMLAAFQTLLYRYTGQEDISIGTPIAGRNRLETEGLIGLFVNTLVMRTVLSPRLTFSELLRQVRDIVLDGNAHQEIPFEKLVEELGVERSLSWTPVFQVLMTLQNASRFTFELPGLKMIPLAVDNNTAKFDLTMFLIESPEGLSATVEYNTDLFDSATILRMLRHFESLVAAATEEAGREVMSLPMMGEAERRQLLEGWNETGREYPREAVIHGLFEVEARRRGEAVAVVSGRERLTYDELNRRANQIANHLLSIGVHIEQRVGICVERSIDMVAGLLAILKAGAVYVPMDPSYPRERLAFILEDAGLSVILVQQRVIDRLPEHSARLVSLDTGWEAISRASESDPDTGVVSENLSYVIYTSGSTGRPKGVAIEHHNAVATLDWARNTFSSEELSSVLASTSICFDLSVFELFAPLSTGGKVVLAENALQLPELPAAGEVRLLNTVPSAMSELTRLNGVPSSVITVSLAGEALQGALVRQIFENKAVGRVLNLYGPSEDTTYSTCASLYRETTGEPTIGFPISNTQVYILDNRLQPVPQGAVGEIYISGEGLSRGYLNSPETTAEKYLPNPFSKEPGSRFYKTGDLARYMHDGNIEFHGRMDHQVKIRGFRIELGEIEAVLAHHPKVRDVVALVREDAVGDKRLITYVVAKEGEELTNPELTGFVRQKLPNYMQPSAFVVLDSLPLTPNGKVDRKALPAPDSSDALREGAYKAPRSHVEEVLAVLWGQVLGVERVGVEDSFFALGGHSLLAAQLVSRIREAFKLEMPLRRIFEAPTIAQMAETVEALRKAEEGLIVPPITRGLRTDKPPLSFAQQRLWFIDRLESGSAFYNIPAAVRLDGLLNTEALERSLNEIVRRHESLRTTFSDSGGLPVQIIAPSLNLALPIFDLRDLSEDERASRTRELISEEFWRPFDLTRGPLIRASLLRIDEQEHILTVCMHHIISDGWSIGVFIDEMARLYGVYSEGKASPLPELMIQYRDYALWQRQWLKGEVLEAEIGYWKKQLEGAPTTIEIKTDGARPAVQTYEGRSESIEIGEEAVRRLKEVGGRQGATMYMVMAAAMEVLMYRYSGQEDMVIGTPVANRVRQETEPLIGCFINVLALRAKLSNNPTYNEMLRQAREVILDALTHQDLPFEKLVEALQIERDPSRSPLFQVMFALQSARNPETELPGLTLTPMDEENKAAHFDLNMAVQEEGQSMSATLTYNIDLFNAETVTQMLSDYKLILEEVSLNPEVTLKELVETLTQVEKQKSDEKQKAFKESSVKKLRKLRRKAFD
jgi:amino acid adenylation domain-containing protein